jgi:hypothetical protein
MKGIVASFHRNLNVISKAEHRDECNGGVNVDMLTMAMYREFVFSPDCAPKSGRHR